VAALPGADYTAGAERCADCRDNMTSEAVKCEAIVDCIIPMWPCTSCRMTCANTVGASAVVSSCVEDLIDAACN
jgi:hypothetical protein